MDIERSLPSLGIERSLPSLGIERSGLSLGIECYGLMFSLKALLLKPYPSKVLSDYERNYNYRLCRTRRGTENAVGIFVNIFCVLAKYIHLEPKKCTVITNPSIALHNFLLEVTRS